MTNVDNSNKLKCFTRTRGGDPNYNLNILGIEKFYPHTRGYKCQYKNVHFWLDKNVQFTHS